MPKEKDQDENKQPSATSRFAHLFGFGKAAAKAEDEDKKDPEAEDEDEKPDAEYDDDDGNDDDKKKPDAEDEKEKEEQAKKAGALAERARCAAIFSCKSAAVRPDMAAHYAFDTDVTAAEAVATLDKIVAGKAVGKTNSLSQRMAETTQPKVSASAPVAEQKTFAQEAVAVYNSLRGKK